MARMGFTKAELPRRREGAGGFGAAGDDIHGGMPSLPLCMRDHSRLSTATRSRTSAS